MLGEVISKVFGTLLPVQAELIFFDSVAHPVESYVKGLGALLEHAAGDYAVRDCAVGLDRGGRLRVAHLGEVSTDGDGLLAVE